MRKSLIIVAMLINTAVLAQEPQTPPPAPPVQHQDLLPTPPGTEMVDALPPVKKGKKPPKMNPKHKSGFGKNLDQPNLDH